MEILKKEQGLTEIKPAFYISGRNPPKRKCYTDKERALKKNDRRLFDSPEDGIFERNWIQTWIL